jgi:hypothetical protein
MTDLQINCDIAFGTVVFPAGTPVSVIMDRVSVPAEWLDAQRRCGRIEAARESNPQPTSTTAESVAPPKRPQARRATRKAT